MSGYFSFDPNTGTGIYMSDEDMKESAGFLFSGILIYALFGLAAILITAIIIAPFLTLFVLDKFVETFIKNNSLFFTILGAFLIATKLFFKRASNNFLIRILFDLYIIVSALYFLLYVFHFDIPVYTYFRVIGNYFPDSELANVWDKQLLKLSTEGNWFYQFFGGMLEKFIDFIKWAFANVQNIDHSCFEATASQIDILLTLKTIGLYIVIGGFALLSTVIGGVLTLLIVVTTIAFPYFIAVLLVAVINKLICKCNVGVIFNTEKKFNNAVKIDGDALQVAIEQFDTSDITIKQSVVKRFKEIADSGNPVAQLLYAQCLYNGDSIKQNKKEAIKWYKKSAHGGMPEALLMLSSLYFEGNEIYKNKALSRTCLNAAMRDLRFKEKYYKKEVSKDTIDYIFKKTKLADCF